MNALQYLRHSPLAVRLGWTILHSLWQGGAVALVLDVLPPGFGTQPAR